MVITGGQCNDGVMLAQVLAEIQQWRAHATRYDKLAITYRAAVTISAILIWLRHIGETP